MSDRSFKSILDAWPSEGLGPTFLTSYTFNAPFFEAELLRPLLRRGAHPIALFVDKGAGLAPALRLLPLLRGAGVDYHLAAVDRGRYAFHPKVHLFCGRNVALVGSGNLTPTGSGGNLEAFDRLDASAEGSAVRAVREFFRELLEDHCSELHPASRRSLVRVLTRSEAPPSTGETVFLHSLSASLKEGLGNTVLGDSYDDVLMVSPFHDRNHGTCRDLGEFLGAASIRVAADRREPPGPSSDFEMGVLDDPRPLHAKVVYGSGAEASVLIVGSANLTRPAWHGSMNVEAITIRQALSRNAFQAWVEEVEFTPQDWPVAPRRELGSEGSQGHDSLPLKWARLKGGVVQVGAPELEEVRFSLEAGTRRAYLESTYQGQDVWKADSPFVPTQAAVLTAGAPGYRASAVLVEQPELLRLSRRLRDLRRLVTRVEAGLVDDDDRRDLLAALGDLFAALQAASASKRPGSGRSPTLQPHQQAPPEGEIEEVESLLAALGGGSQEAQVARLREIARAIARPTRSNAVESTVSRVEEGSCDDARSQSMAVEQVQEELEGQKLEDEEIVQTSLDLATTPGGELRKMAEVHERNAILVLQTTVQLLVALGRSFPDWRRRICRSLLGLLRDAWAVADWPGRVDGWL